ncbi:cupin domain-containing protein [Paenactinomyces guangxiensis]|uniref:Cupin domain-containing protein n=1 Tax=Paenactinomyces guangxiensis TaxID=1490290 RepID=A0A7W1WP93_9BACL|nr:cupin domain-containing protein [Paenactinomyces guangxiensis]MBA4493568.1 cupin domain-containing protein [Paenactinomyces guangxiensis]MBH8590659.1 cupin domain-containing protein [Paenactinomyces guangxiensis]
MTHINQWEQAEPGVRRKIFQPGKEIMMMEVQFEQGAVGSEHSHPHEQITYCLKGRLEFLIEGKKIELSAGESIYIPGDVRHGVKALEESALLDVFTPVREDLLKR